jgi:hypothetical protein
MIPQTAPPAVREYLERCGDAATEAFLRDLRPDDRTES